MTEAIIGTPSVVGFAQHTNGNHGMFEAQDRLAMTIEANERTRDVLSGQRFESKYLSDAINANGIAIEKIAAASELATEKTAAASQLAIEKTAAAMQLAIEKTAAAQQLSTEKVAAAQQLTSEKIGAAQILATEKTSAAGVLLATQNQAAALAQAAECCCEMKELVSAEANRTRDLINAGVTQNLRDALLAAQRFVPFTVPVPLA
jgi:hypothetical protein